MKQTYRLTKIDKEDFWRKHFTARERNMDALLKNIESMGKKFLKKIFCEDKKIFY